MTAKITALSANVGSLGTNKGEAFRFGDDNSGQLAGFRNKLINGGMQVTQRGITTTTAGGTFTADRWRQSGNASGAFSVSVSATSQNLSALGYMDRPNVLSWTQSSAASTQMSLEQRIEDVRTLAGKRVTLSFYAILFSGNFSAASVRLSQVFGSGGSTPVNLTPQNISGLTGSYQKFSFTFDVPSVSGKTIGTDSYLGFEFLFPTTGTWDFAITGVQLEEGSIATPFEQRPIGLELALCQRYYLRKRLLWRWDQALNVTVTVAFIDLFPVQMRIVPTASIISQNNIVFANLFKDAIDVNGGYWSVEPVQDGPVNRRIDSVVDYSAEL